MPQANQREADFLAAFLAGGDALFAGVFLLAVLSTIFLIGTFFAADLAAVLTAVLAGVLEADLVADFDAVLVAVFVAVLLVVLLAFSAGAFLAAAFAAGAALDPTRCPFAKDGLAPLDKRLAAPNFTSLSPQISSRR